ncbi:MAG TPA: glycosyltransferase [Gallionella sp.]|nr:glycosyltransferase [Gallionella sp.]
MSNTPKSVSTNGLGGVAVGRSATAAIEIISATKLAETDFWSKSALGLSLKRHAERDARLSFNIAFENARGLSEIFNGGIEQADDDAILVFMHDDVWIDEENFADTVIAGLERFDVIGVAGNRRRVPNQPAWAFIDQQFTWDDKANLSGRVAHGKTACGPVSDFGAVPAECELLDGVFLSARKSRLKQRGVMFDAQFDFHFYDMDFCRSARQAGLRLGTWPVKLTHQSGGAFGSPQWKAMYGRYLRKWDAPLANNAAAPDREMQQAVNELLKIALMKEGTDQLVVAENLYREILNIQPKHAEANHRLGMLERNLKGVLSALPRLETAVMEQPGNEQYWVAYIDALMQAGAADMVTEALELGQQHGLGREAAQMLAAALSKKLATEQVRQQDSRAAPFGIHIHQIYYSEQTRRDNDRGFIGLDNLANPRPDWREYWPIRNYLLNNSLNADDYYGFLSPKFKSKTNLDAAAVHEYVRAHADRADVFLFSPFFDQGAYHLNIFEQGAADHPGSRVVFRDCAAMIAPDVDLATLVMDSRNTVFCNYIVAKPAFWNAWLAKCEAIFAVAEENKTALAASLNASTNHDGGVAPNKVFVIERIASLMLATQRHWKVNAYHPMSLPYGKPIFAKYPQELLLLDALKIASVEQGYPEYLATFSEVRQSVMTDMLRPAKT